MGVGKVFSSTSTKWILDKKGRV
ncbi:hypothetical protein PENSOL_c050G08678 [Penicillium solitum]|uniref:Uncharacterized protein n=1 Tax=Penicillium solitum TaxID=60172 RepID=A0A1V6QR26_9EURO|nr:hypothetical protein PENSOL_c050G08678 [Penicillium solitum]